MTGPSLGIFLLCIFPCVFSNFHVRVIYPLCTKNLHGTGKRRVTAYKAKYTIFQRILLKPLLAKPHERIFIYLFIQNYLYVAIMVVTLTVFVLEQMIHFTFLYVSFFVVMMGIYAVYTMVTFGVQLEVGRRLA